MATSYLDLNGLKHLWGKAEESFSPIDTKAEDIYAEGIGDTVVSGDPVVLNDVPYEQDASSLSVSFEPIQDLHGYDYPWPPGGGVNKFDASDPLLLTINTYGFTTSIDGEDVVISGTYTGSNSNPQFRLLYYSDERTIPYSAKGFAVDNATAQHFVGYIGKADNNTKLTIILNNCVQGETYTLRIRIVLYEGTTAPTEWTPYSNICPISGRTEMKVERCGKNLIPNTGSNLPYSANGISVTQSENSYIVTANNATGYPFTAIATMNGIKAGVYVFSCVKDNVFTGTNFSLRLVNRSVTPAVVIGNFGSIMVVSNDIDSDLKVEMAFTGASIPNGTYIISDVQLEEGSEATSYEPYTGETYDITFPTEAGTVYGGTLDMLSGVLTVDRAIVKISDLSWNYNTSWLRFDGNGIEEVCKKPESNSVTLPGLASSVYKASSAASTGSLAINGTIGVLVSGVVCIRDESYSNVEEWLNFVGNEPIVYPLANPITYQLDSHTISLLKGYNYISSDNDIKEITIKFQGKGSSTIQNELSEHEEEIRNINQSISSLTSYDIIADGSGETTLSGNEINISNAIGGNAIGLTANISIRQITEEAETVPCGSGTCVITPLEDPYSSVDIIVKNGINQTKNTVALGTSVGGGNIDIINGVGLRKYVCGTYSQFGSKGAASIVDAYYISTLPIDLNLINSCLCNIGICNPSRILDSNITSPVYGYMEQYPNLFFISFPKSFGISTIELANEFLTQVGGLQIMIPVATPTSFSFTPRNIALFSKNNIITGGRGTELLELTYESSTSSNVQIELNKQNVLLNNIINDIAPVEKSTAIENHAVGDYIILNGKFCKVTTAIATGEIITIGINVSQTTISAEILAILSQQNS